MAGAAAIRWLEPESRSKEDQTTIDALPNDGVVRARVAP